MNLLQEINIQNVFVQSIIEDHFLQKDIKFDVLRLDKIHPVISGNKWFKLKYYLQDAIQKNFKTVATAGGAFSNHIMATAYACNKEKIKCIGFIRGEEPKQYSQTLIDAKALNMELVFLSRNDFDKIDQIVLQDKDVYFIPSGGYGAYGVKGAKEILQLVPNKSSYNYIICAVGTGTMLAGITSACFSQQQCVGVSVMKNNFNLENEIYSLTDAESKKHFKVLHEYHFGGYAKYDNTLIDFMNKIWSEHQLPLDFVYTAKALYAVYDLAAQNYFPKGSSILFVHSGGLQGNHSLKNNLLQYQS